MLQQSPSHTADTKRTRETTLKTKKIHKSFLCYSSPLLTRHRQKTGLVKRRKTRLPKRFYVAVTAHWPLSRQIKMATGGRRCWKCTVHFCEVERGGGDCLKTGLRSYRWSLLQEATCYKGYENKNHINLLHAAFFQEPVFGSPFLDRFTKC